MLDRMREVAVEQRRTSLYRVDRNSIKPTRVSGFETTVGAGEVAVGVEFPIWFAERPVMSFGAELEAGQFMEDLKYPTVSVVVAEWTIKYPERGGGFYLGCVLACVTTGKADQRVIVHWSAEGKGYSNPVNQGTSLS